MTTEYTAEAIIPLAATPERDALVNELRDYLDFGEDDTWGIGQGDSQMHVWVNEWDMTWSGVTYIDDWFQRVGELCTEGFVIKRRSDEGEWFDYAGPSEIECLQAKYNHLMEQARQIVNEANKCLVELNKVSE